MDTLGHNIETFVRARRRQEQNKPWTVRLADRITRFIGSLTFVVIQTVAVATWIATNELLLEFDPYPYALLTLLLSIEAIYLTAFVLISQNRMSAVSDERTEADLQINLLAERADTRILRIVDAIARKVGAPIERDAELRDLEKDVDPDDVLRRVEAEPKPNQ